MSCAFLLKAQSVSRVVFAAFHKHISLVECVCVSVSESFLFASGLL